MKYVIIRIRYLVKWNNRAIWLLYDKKVRLKIKGKLCKTDVRPTMMYGTEYLTSNKEEKMKIEVGEIRILSITRPI